MITQKTRLVRFVTALSIAGLISAQVPMSGGTALAADGYTGNNSGQFLGTKLTNEQVFSGATIGVLGYTLYKTLRGTASGGVARGGGGVTAPVAPSAAGFKVPLLGDSNKPIYDVVAGDNGFSGMKGLIDGCPDMVDSLRNQGPFTFFAPDNGTLGGVPAGRVSALQASKAKLCDLIETHTVIGRYKYEDLLFHGEKKLLTLSGKTVQLSHRGNRVFLDGIEVVPSDIAASNGWIHPLKGIFNN